MKKLRCLVCCLLILLSWSALEAAPSGSVQLPLLDPRNPAGWQAVEASITPVLVDGEPAALFHIPINWYGGEKEYPIGWPRLQRELSGELADWSQWEKLKLRIRATTSGGPLPQPPLGLSARSKQGTAYWERELAVLPSDQWTEVVFDLDQVSGRGAMQSMGLFISEDNYQHGMTVSFLITEFSLLRYTEPTLTGLQIGTSLAFAEAGALPVTLEMLGLPLGSTRPAEILLIRNEKTIATKRVEAGEGKTHVSFPLPKGVVPGEYLLRAKHQEQHIERPLRLINSPWQEGAR